MDNPNANSYRNAFWSFSDETGKIALCVWYRDVTETPDFLHYSGNLQSLAIEFENDTIRRSLSAGEKTSLRMRAAKARDFHRTVGTAFRGNLPVRIIVLGDDVALPGEAAHADFRLLDPSVWHVASFDGQSGAFVLQQGDPPQRAPDGQEADEDREMLNDVARIQETLGLSDTEKLALLKQRVGQGLFRQRLMARWKTCALTGCSQLLVASHIVPWRECTSARQRLGAHNGLLLTAHIDQLFDRGLIAFDNKFEIMISPELSMADRSILNIMPNQRLRSRHSDLLDSLRWHREMIFRAD